VGKCKFGAECTFDHPEDLKGGMVELAGKIKAENLGGKKGVRDGEKAGAYTRSLFSST